MKPAQNRQPVPFERRGAGTPRTPFKQKAWNHQDELKDGVGKEIALLFPDGSVKAGELVAADQFTLKVRLDTSVGKSALTFFKSSLTAYGFKA